MNDDPPKPLTLKIRIPAFKRAQPPPEPEPQRDPTPQEEYDESEQSQSASPISVDEEEDEEVEDGPQDTPMSTSAPSIHIKLPVLKLVKKEKEKAVSKPKPRSRPKLFGRVTGPKPTAQGVLLPAAPVFKKPPKLKRLSELLPKVLAKIKKKDHYGIFLNPVDTDKFPAYLTVIKFPMDLSTMEKKMESGEYTSLDQFGADFRLMIQNCKTFNPSPSLYFTEAAKLETYGNDAISQVAGQLAPPGSLPEEPTPVRTQPQPMEIDVPGPSKPTATPASPTTSRAGPSRSESIAPGTATPLAVPPSTPATAQSISFAHAEWQRRQQFGHQKAWVRGPYKKTVAREVPGLGPDGELPGAFNGVGEYPVGSDWGKIALALEIRGKRYRTKKERLELEKRGQPTLWDGSIDYAQLEDPFAVLHHFTPAPPIFPPMNALTQPSDAALDSFPITVTADHLARRTREISKQTEKQLPPYFVQNTYTNASRKSAPMDVDDDQQPMWALPERRVLHTDLGVFQSLGDVNVDSLAKAEVKRYEKKDDVDAEEEWTYEAAKDGVEYIRDTVYGGTEGLAYSRSLLDFIQGAKPQGAEPLAEDEEWEDPPGGLGMSLAEWVQKNVLSPATGGLHDILAQGTHHIVNPPSSTTSDPVSTQISTSLHINPDLRKRISGIAQRRTEPIQLSSLLKTESDLLAPDSEWDQDAKPEDGAVPVFSPVWADKALKLAARRVEELAEASVDEKEETAEVRALRLNLLALTRFVPLSEGLQMS